MLNRTSRLSLDRTCCEIIFYSEPIRGEFILFGRLNCADFFLMRFIMKYAVVCVAVLAAVVPAFSPASAEMMSCSGADMSKMATMMGAMPDGPKKWEMNKDLAMINTAMAKDGTRGCRMTMKKMMMGSKMPMMKSEM
jgi:hypothetical protein